MYVIDRIHRTVAAGPTYSTSDGPRPNVIPIQIPLRDCLSQLPGRNIYTVTVHLDCVSETLGSTRLTHIPITPSQRFPRSPARPKDITSPPAYNPRTNANQIPHHGTPHPSHWISQCGRGLSHAPIPRPRRDNHLLIILYQRGRQGRKPSRGMRAHVSSQANRHPSLYRRCQCRDDGRSRSSRCPLLVLA
jgi:hypothetical protein